MAHYEQRHSDQGVRTEDGAQMDNGLHINQQPSTCTSTTSENTTAESLEIGSENEQPLNTSATARKETKQAPINLPHHRSTTFQTSVAKSISKVLPNKNIKMLHQYDQLRSDRKHCLHTNSNYSLDYPKVLRTLYLNNTQCIPPQKMYTK